MSTSTQIKMAIAKLKKLRHQYQQKGNKKMIDDTLKREALLEKELVKIQWKERQIDVIKAQKVAKERQKALAKEERELKWGPTLNTLRSIGKSVGGAVKQGVRVYKSKKRSTGINRVLDNAGSNLRKVERRDAIASEKRPPDSFHTSRNIQNGYNMEQIDSHLAEKVRRTRGG